MDKNLNWIYRLKVWNLTSYTPKQIQSLLYYFLYSLEAGSLSRVVNLNLIPWINILIPFIRNFSSHLHYRLLRKVVEQL